MCWRRLLRHERLFPTSRKAKHPIRRRITGGLYYLSMRFRSPNRQAVHAMHQASVLRVIVIGRAGRFMQQHQRGLASREVEKSAFLLFSYPAGNADLSPGAMTSGSAGWALIVSINARTYAGHGTFGGRRWGSWPLSTMLLLAD